MPDFKVVIGMNPPAPVNNSLSVTPVFLNPVVDSDFIDGGFS